MNLERQQEATDNRSEQEGDNVAPGDKASYLHRGEMLHASGDLVAERQ